MADATHDIDWSGKKARRATLQSFVRKFLLFPDFWRDADRHILEALEWKKLAFIEGNHLSVPTGSGIYCFILRPPMPNNFWDSSYVLYIGKAAGVSLRSRYKTYHKEKLGIGIGDQKARIKVEEILNDFDGNIEFWYAKVSGAKKAKEYEDKLLRTYMPYVNSHHPEAQINEEYRHIY